uniref:Uncharacterized protein n=1 Tax=Arundo donax TaxID=35708 RepID=A0A0A9B1U4_ARUDO
MFQISNLCVCVV